MKSFRIFPAVALFISLFFSSGAFATIDPTAPVVALRSSCVEADVTLNNCFTTMQSLVSWIHGTRKPTASNPLLVNIGPGTFGTYSCVNSGYITLRGAGRQNTVIGGPNGSTTNVNNCTNLTFQDMKITKASNFFNTIVWSGGGISIWDNVDVIANGYAWVDMDLDGNSNGCNPQQKGKHYWFGSRVVAQGDIFGITKGYLSWCGEAWFFGSELSALPLTYGQMTISLEIHHGSEAHFYGSVIRAINPAGVTSGLAVVVATDNASVHIHGTGIDAISPAPANIVVLAASSGAKIHANQSSYNLETGEGGTVTRISNNGGHVHAPYLWEHIPDPAVTPNFTSVNGADMTTEMIGADINLLVYNSQCTGSGGPWYNVALRTCR